MSESAKTIGQPNVVNGKMFEYCKSDIKGINFIKVSKEDIGTCQANVVYEV